MAYSYIFTDVIYYFYRIGSRPFTESELINDGM